MEVNCPHCTQRLRFPDHLSNPLLKCTTCQATFRPSDYRATKQPPAAAPYAEAVDELEEWNGPVIDVQSSPPAPASSKTFEWGVKGLGSFGVIAILLAIKIVPRIVREVMRERKPPVPAQVREEDRRAVEKLLRDAQENAGHQRVPHRIPQPAERPQP